MNLRREQASQEETPDRRGKRRTGKSPSIPDAPVADGADVSNNDDLKVQLAELTQKNQELRQTRLAMEAALEKYADLYDFAPMGYFTLDADGLIQEVNQTGMTLLGAVRSALVGRRFSLFLAEPSRVRFHAFMEELSGGAKRAICEVALWGGAPGVQWVRIHGGPTEGGGRDGARCRIAVTDITDIRDAEQEQSILQAQVQQSQRLESLGVLAGGIAHDFNNMLMAISGNAGLALEEIPTGSAARTMVEEIIAVAGRAAELCAQMLAYAGKGRFRMAPLNLSKMAAEMSHMLAVSISKKALISCRLHEKLPPIRADIVQMRQVLMSLILNAAEAIGDNSGSISVSTGVMECSREFLLGVRTSASLSPGTYVFLEVTDTGCGMSREVMDRMFDPFFTTKATGRGLGLSAAIGIVQSHGGGIFVKTAPGGGTTVTLLFPPDKSVETETALPDKTATGWRGKGTVLLVDDEETIRIVCRRMLQYLGLDVLVAKDGREALALYSAHRDEIGCVLLDFAMPQFNGEETFHELRNINPDVRVILSSGYLMEDVTIRFEGSGLTGFIHKPYEMEQLMEVMKGVFTP